MNDNLVKTQAYLSQLRELIFNKHGVELISETYVSIEGKIKIIDALITVNKKPLAVFEFKENINSLSKQQIFSLADDFKVDVRFIVITNGAISKIIDNYNAKFDSLKDVTALVAYLFREITVDEINALKPKIKDEIDKEVNSFKRHLSGLMKKQKGEILESKIAKIEAAAEIIRGNGFMESIQYDKDGQFFHMISDIRNFDLLENRFFKSLVEDVLPGSFIHRYTTLDSIYRTIEGGKIRLSGIVGMNDISEVGYVETYLDKKFKPMSNDDHIDSVNRKYIMCSSILEDELMQWRLYGDDCKGGCLIFEVIENAELPGLLLRKISYGIEIDGENYHPELELLLRIQSRIKRSLKIEFKFRTLEIWKHFFKSFEYAPEEEVRLLLIGNNEDEIKGEKNVTGVGNPIEIKWNLTGSHQILSPFILLELNDARLRCKLNKVLLGAKCPEIGVNLKQFKHLVNKRQLNGVNVEPSKIKNYR